jgi:hypothetical protein
MPGVASQRGRSLSRPGPPLRVDSTVASKASQNPEYLDADFMQTDFTFDPTS